jgi:hypothetical protein
MATELCQKCKQSHPGRACDYDEKGDCAETADLTEVAKKVNQESNERKKAE